MTQSGFTVPSRASFNVRASCVSVIAPLKPGHLLLACAAVLATWSAPGLAQQVVDGGGNLSVLGEQQGVSMINGGTLTVGMQDIFINNAAALLPGTAVSTDANATHSIVFNGSSTVHGDVGAPGLIFDSIATSAGALNVNFRGTVFTTTMNVATTAVSFNSGTGTNVGAVNFTGDGSVALGLNTILTGALTTNTANTGTLILNNGSRWDGAVGGANGLRAITVTGNAASAGITGAVDVNSLNLGNNTLNITGNLRIRNPGPNSINTTLTSDTVFGNVVATGGATTFPATLGVNVTVPSTTLLTVGTEFDIINSEAGPGTSVVSVTVQNPTNPLYTFSAVPTLGGDVTITLTGVPLTAVGDPLADVILGAPLTPDLTEALAAVNALNTPAAVADALAQLRPSSASLAAPQVLAFERSRMLQNLSMARLDVCRGDARYYDNEVNPQTCRDNNDPRSGLWAKVVGRAGEQDARAGTFGYDSTVYGGMIGYDMPVGPDTRAGVGVGYARSNIDGKRFDSDTDFDSWMALAYAGHEFGPWFLQGNASVGLDDYSSQRNIRYPGVTRSASADFDGIDYSVFANLGYRHNVTREVRVIPNASVRYSYVKLDKHTEKGAGDLNLSVNSQSYDALESGLGVRIERDFSYRGGLAVIDGHFNWYHRHSNPTPEMTARFMPAGSQPFTTRGRDVASNSYNVGVSVNLLSCDTCDARSWALHAVYDYEWTNDDYSSHQGMLRLSARY